MPPLPSVPPLPPGIAATATVGGVFVVVLLGMLGARYLLVGRLKRWATATTTRVDDLVLAAIHTPSLFWAVAIALAVALRASPLDAELAQGASRAVQVILLVSMTLVTANIAGGVATQVLRGQSSDGQVTGLGQTIIKGVVIVLGGMVVLNALGVEIAPLLTALGVGGLAVALALQDSLTNFFAGIHILLERPYTIGNFIQMEGGKEGHVLDIGWRTTRIRTIQDDVIVVPNSKMAGSTILNYHMPIPRSQITLRVGVDYANDPEHVRAVLVDVVRTARPELDYLLELPPPEALLLRFGDFSLDFELRFTIDDIAKQPYALDELHRRVFARFREEGIAIPYPVRTVVMKGV
ncbi:MAG: mechanosensitive ion channel family protein [Pseudomonadota bacterium]|nr:mechanosensitive ion channel family protein [Pseudomonadota bacterium]